MTTGLGFLWQASVLTLVTRWIGDRRVKIGISRHTKKDVLFLKELIEVGMYQALIRLGFLDHGESHPVPGSTSG